MNPRMKRIAANHPQMSEIARSRQPPLHLCWPKFVTQVLYLNTISSGCRLLGNDPQRSSGKRRTLGGALCRPFTDSGNMPRIEGPVFDRGIQTCRGVAMRFAQAESRMRASAIALGLRPSV